MKTIICIAGGSGVGKTYAAAKLAALFNANEHACKVVCSYTTRPMRPGETQGVEHQFVDDLSVYERDKANDNVLADTVYGGHTYWASAADLIDGINLYVIDEAGIESLRTFKKRHSDIRLFTVKLTAWPEVIAARGIDADRIARDPSLTMQYDLTCRNNAPADVFSMYSALKTKLHIVDEHMTFCVDNADMKEGEFCICMYKDNSNYQCSITRGMTIEDMRRLHAAIADFLQDKL